MCDGDDEDHFSWFICGKKYSEDGIDFLEVPTSTRFYDVESGRTYGPRRKLKVQILSSTEPQRPVLSDGYTKRVNCNPSRERDVVCHEIEFYLYPHTISTLKREETCSLIQYAKTHYAEIQQRIPEFPTAEMIDALLEKSSCRAVCKVLYDLMYI